MTIDFDALTIDFLRRRATAKWSTYDPDVLALWVAEMDFPTAPVVLEAIRDAVERQQFGYLSATAPVKLAEATAAWAEVRYGWKVDADRVHLLPDVVKGVELGVSEFTDDDSPIVITTPAYMPFFEVPRAIRRPSIEVPMLQDEAKATFDLDGIAEAFRAGARSIILCNPYNPLGRSFSDEELGALAEVVDHHGARVVSDEIHAPLTYASAHIPYASVSELAASHSVTVISATKAWSLPGLRCAQLITTNDADEERWQRTSFLLSQGASSIGVDASIAAYQHGAGWLDEVLAYLDRNRHHLSDLLAEHLPEVSYVEPEATYLAWLDFSALDLGVEPSAFFLEHARVAMNAGTSFGKNGAGYARLNFATSRQLLERAVSAMGEAVRRARR